MIDRGKGIQADRRPPAICLREYPLLKKIALVIKYGLFTHQRQFFFNFEGDEEITRVFLFFA
jgi:hypothetical protein